MGFPCVNSAVGSDDVNAALLARVVGFRHGTARLGKRESGLTQALGSRPAAGCSFGAVVRSWPTWSSSRCSSLMRGERERRTGELSSSSAVTCASSRSSSRVCSTFWICCESCADLPRRVVCAGPSGAVLGISSSSSPSSCRMRSSSSPIRRSAIRPAWSTPTPSPPLSAPPTKPPAAWCARRHRRCLPHRRWTLPYGRQAHSNGAVRPIKQPLQQPIPRSSTPVSRWRCSTHVEHPAARMSDRCAYRLLIERGA